MGSFSQLVKERQEKSKTLQVAAEKSQAPQTESAVERRHLLGVRKPTHAVDQ